MREFFGPLKVAFDKIGPPEQEKLTQELLGLLRAANQSGDTTLYVPCEYLEAVVYL
jgi:hypothetical protein